MELDKFDVKILSVLQTNARTTTAEMSQEVGMSDTACWRRMKRLEEEGYIEANVAVLDKHKLGLKFEVIVNIEVDIHTTEETQNFEEVLALFPQVLGFYSVTGEYDFILHVVVKDADTYRCFIDNALRKLPCIKKITSCVILHTIKHTTKLPFHSM